MASSEDQLQCYNKGCGKKFNSETNNEDACKHHPGVPVFHDALKGWSCCKKRSTDFTEFLNIPGCTSSQHSNVKPAEPEKQQNESNGTEIEVKPAQEQVIRAPVQPQVRPTHEQPPQRLAMTVGASLQQALDKQMNQLSLNKTEETVDASEVKPGTSCKNAGCTQQYTDEGSDQETCTYHAGVPIFHEGMKYWTCCKRKTSDFNSFLSQEGCTTGKHLWFKKESEEKKKTACRFDWHQTGASVIISVFAKLALPEKSWVEANQVSVNINILFDGGNSLFTKDIVLQGVVDPTKSTVKMLGTKVEINLKKAEPGSWSRLELAS